MLKFKNNYALNPECPVITPWRTVSPINTPLWALERNPYFWGVDTDGNQLPYIDKIQLTLAENLEVANLRAIAGEYDQQTRHLDLAKLPVFLENQQKGNYKVVLDPTSGAAAVGDPRQPELRGRPRDPQVAHQRRFPPRALAGHRPRPVQRGVLPRDGHAQLADARGRLAGERRAGVADQVVDPRRQPGQRAAGQDRADQEGRRGVPPAHRQRPAPAHRESRPSRRRSCRTPR